ncbi:1-acyl-sn-glycerol-3-phosphate acyltransferase [Candidatus Arsenophonus lipoptenae]|uniref:1-acyl-sn-glycerol-3-phosphate acyltransferase n=1 Tax=Candidatus Arsenophonus lipoptenae TaxID=634113 RepID=A0A0X9VZ79_9GAMM|nr:1-acylglycerol-3-phosphate O-acyltransferase [Candidatus Arsenophonus lipoptenae]AMA64985.1 1-acyl-sn-glycerol-3-phosphate acyltransferase [Candidatus Arsenophonus lipoptenae]
MLAVIRIFIVIIFTILVCILGFIYCLFNPRNPRHVMYFGRLFGKLSYIFGITIITRIPLKAKNYGPSIYIGNHQNNYDMITMSNVVQPNTITVGKKSLLFIPFFGLLYWLTGNILIDRTHRMKSYYTIARIVKQIKKKKISIWMFPEGTRSRGKGLLPFKTGAFHVAIAAGVPIVPICLSETYGRIKLNRWNNGIVIVEMLEPIDTTKYNKENIQELSDYCYNLFRATILRLNKEVINLEKTK